MTLSFDLVRQFPAGVRERGERYFADGRVKIVDIGSEYVEARVLGSARYNVFITVTPDGALDYECDCPFSRDVGACKHVWATLRAADAEGWGPTASSRTRASRESGPTWSSQLRALSAAMARDPMTEPAPFPANRRLVYVLDFYETSMRTDGLLVDVRVEARLKSGEWGPPKELRLSNESWLSAPDAMDREIAQMLLGARHALGYDFSGSVGRRYVIPVSAFDSTLRRMLETGRARLLHDESDTVTPLTFDDGGGWEFQLEITPRDGRFHLQGIFVREDVRLPLEAPEILMRGGIFVHEHRLSRFRDDGQFDLLHALRTGLDITVDEPQLLDLLEELYRLPRLPALRVPDQLGIRSVEATPVPRLDFVASEPRGPWAPDRIEGRLSFEYAGVVIDAGDPRNALFDRDTRQVLHRVRDAERAATTEMHAAGFKRERSLDYTRVVHGIATNRTVRVATEFMARGWRVGLDGLSVRPALDFDLAVTSGIDWFDVTGDVDFGSLRVSLPELLAAVRKGERMVSLADGTLGMLPDELAKRLALIGTTGELTDGKLRYARAQVGVLDALLAAAPSVQVDEAFTRLRDEVRRFDGISPRDPPPGFVGTLRHYQCEGLGWLAFLQRLRFGGCLADDMGLGKTVQAIALLQGRRDDGAGPSLVVVPNSLVFNWQQEVARFAPALRVHAHLGGKRKRETLRFPDTDLVITTYGTLRQDAVALSAVEFDYVILDEAQAIKNAQTASAKAARTLKARHRLAMTGTPIENRLEELWSIFEFLNPRLLGSSASFARVMGRSSDTEPGNGHPGREFLARALRPYILRRTKEQVAPELPEKLEQTLLVDLSAADRRRYDELRDHYRASIMGRIARSGMAKSRVHVLEALLRLRQASCHPGLIKPELAGESSSKLDVLEARVSEIAAEGHKVLVFSQFTSLLAIVKKTFDRAGLAYAYLDGKTRDREDVVTRFQTDSACPVFLISLKAGGLGLNLTAADYVFLLDPWWNPAVEAQAIDRTHRIGQTKRVFATRIIARDTVEEKVLQLQERKRDLADAIIRADGGPLSSLTREDLELLLG
jgi:superfamily II DNA or RNA helicase